MSKIHISNLSKSNMMSKKYSNMSVVDKSLMKAKRITFDELLNVDDRSSQIVSLNLS